MNREMFHNGFDPNQPHPQRMLTFDEESMTCALTLIENVCRQDFDGTLGSLDRTVCLSQILFQDPLSFFEEYFTATDSDHNKELRAKVTEFISRPEFDPHSMGQLKQFTESV